jgi:hypothetical protein
LSSQGNNDFSKDTVWIRLDKRGKVLNCDSAPAEEGGGPFPSSIVLTVKETEIMKMDVVPVHREHSLGGGARQFKLSIIR